MALDSERAEELFSELGPVRVKRMFGGSGVYLDGLMFAIEARDALYLKADPSTAAAFEAEGCGPFAYDTKHGRRVSTSYWRVPDRLLDDPAELAAWARRSLVIAQAKASARRKPARR